MTPQERLNHYLKVTREIVDLQERMQSHMLIKREELFLAMKAGDPAKIENARQQAVDTFSAFLDELIKAHKNVMDLAPK